MGFVSSLMTNVHFSTVAASSPATSGSRSPSAMSVRYALLTSGAISHFSVQASLRSMKHKNFRNHGGLDDFKHVNDTHGHDVGNQVLKWAGLVLRNNIRQVGLARTAGHILYLVLCIDREPPWAWAMCGTTCPTARGLHGRPALRTGENKEPP
ncbi:MAG: diguanylate cyclase [Desulfovibrio sp.]|nr:diguanylate cyclase [Desulfovibrio sp.]